MTSTYLCKTITRWFYIVVIALLVAGCAREPQMGEPGGPAPAVVDVWHSLQGAEAQALQVQAQMINQTHPEVIIKLSYVPEKKFVAFSYQAEAGGEGPELFIASREIIRQLYEQGALAPTVYEDQEGFPAASKGFRFGGEEYGLPWLTDIPLLYFRTDTAAIPVNLSDLFSAKGGVSVAATDTSTLSAWWNGQGGRLMNGGVPALDDPNNVVFLQQLFTWQSAKALRIDPATFTAFSGGQTPYMIAGASAAKSLTQLNVPWGSLLLSDLLNGQGQSLLGTTLGIANSATKTNETMRSAIQTVEKALLAPEVEGAMLEAGRLLPANMGYYQRPEAQKGVFPQAKLALDRAWALEGNAPEWKLIPLQNLAWSNALAGNVAPLDALVSAQEHAREVLTP
ncbi:extracellular solute-binding protein [Desulfosporosinus sp. BICA1-9]|uniref:extracellular solute-binding protein n=1 Tax=Desulfosporosinus sp. BICA1-9 TaxID=1531958 RepID=UPI0005F242AF|nr:extracellular solute-binding protein [Desulfosporosinus sp. BICA1-9]KJS50383.1 MAG: ABC transporter substrate-binding protein [Peptococcaceae bacterium BRH_c23]KJS89573.1 MAG: ABC transporter substrate-binding protein [Desulfosporosinus sp. BICA1-9]HBW34813.1 ABC transporter substrate-binding protein [Desulfosporosinus sp.]